MTWVVWRQYRMTAAIAAALLAALAILLLITGLQVANEYHNALKACTASNTCGNLANTLNLGANPGNAFVSLSIGVPAILGLFWGAPMVAREIEAGTVNFGWTQSVTRWRWLAAKTSWLLLAAALWGGAVAALVTWWSGPENALNLDRFNLNVFDVQGIVPVGYAVFAVALGIATGTIVRHMLPALAITLGGFVALRFVIANYLRPHYMTALTLTQRVGGGLTPKGAYWGLGSGITTASGGAISASGGGPNIGLGNVTIPIPAACRGLVGPGQGIQNALSCIGAHGYREYTTYQPAYRYWPFQFIETGVSLALALICVAVTFYVVRHRDA
jgi:hypothetical protein